MKEEKEDWSIVIQPETSIFSINFKEIWQYRDLLYIFIRKELVSVYKQTLLGPLWFFIQPILTTVVFTVVFGNIAGISTDGKPKILFYLSGIVLWNYFADCLTSTANTFTANAAIFGKVYFPRIILPMSKVISNLLKMFIQFLLLVFVYVIYTIKGKFSLQINAYLFTLPVLILIMANLGLGLGMIITSLTTKYRDLQFLIVFGVQLLMYAAPVIYPLKSLEKLKYYPFVAWNPITSVIETFRASLLGGYSDMMMLLYSLGVSFVLLAVGFLIFNKVERSFIDTV